LIEKIEPRSPGYSRTVASSHESAAFRAALLSCRKMVNDLLPAQLIDTARRIGTVVWRYTAKYVWRGRCWLALAEHIIRMPAPAR
jgi:hypothetical protein